MSDAGESWPAALTRGAHLPARWFFAVAFVAAALLALTQPEWADRFGLTGGPPWLRLALTAAAILFFVIGCLKVAGARTARAEEARASSKARERAAARSAEHERRTAERFNLLTPIERSVLVYYALRGEQSFFMPLHHVPTRSLVDHGLVQMARQGNMLAMRYTIEPAAWELIRTVIARGQIAPETRAHILSLSPDEFRERTDLGASW